MPGPHGGPGGPHGPHGGMMGGPRGPMFHERRPMFYQPRRSYLGTGLSALIGSAIGASIVNNSTKQYASKGSSYNNTNYYEVFSYCPECGTKRNGSSTNCVNCGSSLIK